VVLMQLLLLLTSLVKIASGKRWSGVYCVLLPSSDHTRTHTHVTYTPFPFHTSRFVCLFSLGSYFGSLSSLYNLIPPPPTPSRLLSLLTPPPARWRVVGSVLGADRSAG